MTYYAEYTILVNGGTWGKHEFDFKANTEEEAVEVALDYEKNYRKGYGEMVEELLLNALENEKGEEVKWQR